jgi:4-amino-4-deoxy-L-arabinose transferase-like glycosyltransferase
MRIQLLLALLLFPTVLIYCASFPPIGSSSEAREVHIARIIYETGNWILPERNGILPSKPPLYHWLVATSGHLMGGVDEAIARAVSIIAATIMLIGLMRFCGSLYKSSPTSAALAQGFAGMIASSSYLFLSLATNCRVDMIFATCTSMALLIACRNILEDRFQFHAWSIFWVWSGLAILAKGPLGLALPVIITTIFILSDRETPASSRFKSTLYWNGLMGLGVAGMIALPWYILATIHGGEGFIAKQLLFENIKRISGGSHMNTESWYYYGPAFIRSLFPWSLLYIYAFLYPGDGLRIYGEKRLPQAPLSKSQHLAHLWILGVLMLFTLASGKRTSYLLPLLPPVVIACTVFLVEGLRRRSPLRRSTLNRIRLLVGNTSIFLFGLVAVGTVFYLTDAYYLVAIKHYLIKNELYHYTAVYAGVFGLGTLLLLTGRLASALRPGWGLLLLFTGTWIGLTAILNLGMSVKNNLKGFVRQAQAINSAVPHDAQLYIVRKYRQEYFDPLMFYLHRSVQPVYPDIFQKVSKNEAGEFYVLGFDDELHPQLSANRRYALITTLNPSTDAAKGTTIHKLSLWQRASQPDGGNGTLLERVDCDAT